MATKTDCRRSTRRFRISEDGIWVEFEHPSPGGRRWRLPVIDLSICGFSFIMEGAIRGIDHGSSLSPVALIVGSCRMSGEVLVMHLTREAESGPVCGVLFYPSSDDELLKLKSVIAGIEAVQRT